MATYDDISPGKTLERKVRLVMTNLGANNNKFYDVCYYTDGTAQGKNGRVGDPGVFQKPLSRYQADALLREKIAKGYREVDLVEDGQSAVPAVTVTNSYGARPAVSSQTFEETVVEHLAGNNADLERLLRVVVRANRHALQRQLGIEDGNVQTNASGMRYNVQTGQWSTPLGIVKPATVAKARSVLNEINSYVSRGAVYDPQFTRLVNDYMMLIPQAIGRGRTTAAAILGDNAAISKQIALLDGLEASVQLSSSTPAPAADTTSAKPKPKFEVELALASAAELAKWQQQYVSGSEWAAKIDSGHRSRQAWKIAKLYKIDIRPMTVAYDTLRAMEMQYPAMALWHSTSIGNVLSILTRGFMLPSSISNGWAFGPGVYFSDVGSKSTNYCEGDPSFSYICQVNMGRIYELLDWGTSAIPAPVKSGKYDTTWAVGKTHLQALGRPASNHSGVQHNEMIVYDTRRIKPFYLVEWAKSSSRW